MLSGDKEERTELIMLLVRNLLKENKELRTMIKNMAAFVGEGTSDWPNCTGYPLTHEQVSARVCPGWGCLRCSSRLS